MVWVSAVILLALLQYVILGMIVGRARMWYGVSAPACTGHPKFERWFRVHQNSLEMLIAFIPAMWLFGAWVSPTWAVGVGLVFVAARIIYTAEYVAEPKSRVLGAGLSFLTVLGLVVGGFVGCVRIALTN
jgi:glutathione S-transferase